MERFTMRLGATLRRVFDTRAEVVAAKRFLRSPKVKAREIIATAATGTAAASQGRHVLLIEPHQTIVVEEGWGLEVTAHDHVVMRRVTPLRTAEALGTAADPVLLEVFNNLFMSIAEQMGVRLQNTASSVNIKERLDFSCAVFDRDGALVANAPHMPVHFGSMDMSVRSVIGAFGSAMRQGDVYALNAPTTAAPTCPTSPW